MDFVQHPAYNYGGFKVFELFLCHDIQFRMSSNKSFLCHDVNSSRTFLNCQRGLKIFSAVNNTGFTYYKVENSH